MRKKKKPNLEYRLFILPAFDEVRRKHSTLFRLETVKEFSTFNYEIVMDTKVADRKIIWNIHGLRSPAMSLPHFGAATFTRHYEDLRGKYEFMITKLDGAENAFTLNLTEQKVTVTKSPRQRFIEILTSAKFITPTT